VKHSPKLHHHRSDESTGCDGAGGVLKVSGFSEESRTGDGRRFGFGAYEHVCGDGVQGPAWRTSIPSCWGGHGDDMVAAGRVISTVAGIPPAGSAAQGNALTPLWSARARAERRL